MSDKKNALLQKAGLRVKPLEWEVTTAYDLVCGRFITQHRSLSCLAPHGYCVQYYDDGTANQEKIAAGKEQCQAEHERRVLEMLEEVP